MSHEYKRLTEPVNFAMETISRNQGSTKDFTYECIHHLYGADFHEPGNFSAYELA